MDFCSLGDRFIETSGGGEMVGGRNGETSLRAGRRAVMHHDTSLRAGRLTVIHRGRFLLDAVAAAGCAFNDTVAATTEAVQRAEAPVGGSATVAD